MKSSKELKFKYSKSYPDKKEIESSKKAISDDELMQVVESFNWKSELKKKIEYYSPSLDFIKLEDKTRFIMSGLGDSNLEGFQIKYLKPKSNWFFRLFNVTKYKNADCYTQEVSVHKGYSLLQNFINGREAEILSSLDKVIDKTRIQKKYKGPNKISISNPTQNAEQANSKLEFKKVKNNLPIIGKDAKEVKKKVKPAKAKQPLFSYPGLIEEYYKKPLYERIMWRILGPLATLLFFLPAFLYIVTEHEINIIVVILGSISLLYLYGTIKFEMWLQKKKK